MREILFGSVAAVAALLAACSTEPPIPAALQYSPPAMSARVATIKGVQHRSALYGHPTLFVIGIDGKRLLGGYKAWSTPIPLAEGSRSIEAEFVRGDFKAQAELSFNANPGMHYELGFHLNMSVISYTGDLDVWIINADTGKPVTEPKRVVVTLGAHGEGTMVPIPVPRGPVPH